MYAVCPLIVAADFPLVARCLQPGRSIEYRVLEAVLPELPKINASRCGSNPGPAWGSPAWGSLGLTTEARTQDLLGSLGLAV